jgi:hypothetical protein
MNSFGCNWVRLLNRLGFEIAKQLQTATIHFQ